MSHDTIARTVFGVSHETIVKRILRTFDRATTSDLEDGARWYDVAGNLASDLAIHSTQWGTVTPRTAAAVIAQLSPRTTWQRNVAAATALIYGSEDDARQVGAIGANIDRAVAALLAGADGQDAIDTINGPKTNAFARNIAGDREAVTVDVWAARVADLDETLLGRKGAYDAVAHAYRVAARRRGVDPTTMQAVTWIVARNGRAA